MIEVFKEMMQYEFFFGLIKLYHVFITVIFLGIYQFTQSEYFPGAPARCQAHHILLETEEEALEVKKLLEEGGDFVALARRKSTCPSWRNGGKLDRFAPGKMIKEFEDVCFGADTELGVVYGPVKTKVGYHLIKVTDKPKAAKVGPEVKASPAKAKKSNKKKD